MKEQSLAFLGVASDHQQSTMSVPGFQSWFLPLLKRLSDGKPQDISELYETLANDLGLSTDDRAEMLKSGRQFVYENRIGWARTYLKKAGLVESPSRGLVQITDRGRHVLAQGLGAINVRFLKQFPEFVEFHTYRPQTENSVLVDENVPEEETPRDTLERVQRELQDQLAADLIDRIKKAPPAFFERLVVDLLLQMGYGGSHEDAGRTIGKAGDGGIDGIINEDRLGLDVVYIQAKRWENPVGRPVVQAFAGSLEGVRARKGVLITTSTFTSEAFSYVRQIEKRIVLIDGQQLATYMIQYNVGVALEASYEVKRMDLDYFGEA